MKPILAILFLTSLGMAHAGEITARLTEAAVTSGAGREPEGPLPPSRFGARLEITGLPTKGRPRFKAWSLSAPALASLQAGAKLTSRAVRATPLACSATPDGSAYFIQGHWKGPQPSGAYLVVEVMVGRRRVALATAPVTEHLLPAAKPQGTASAN